MELATADLVAKVTFSQSLY